MRYLRTHEDLPDGEFETTSSASASSDSAEEFLDGFDIVAVFIEDTYAQYTTPAVDQFRDLTLNITYGLYGFMTFCVLLAILASIHAHVIGADNVRVMGIVYFGIWGWDFVSDVIFAARTAEQGYYYQTIASTTFIIIPWCLNMRQLFKQEQKWCNDPTIKHRVNSWMFDHSILLILLAGFSGSAFSAVEICNSQAFGLDFFIMGLTERHLKAFNGSRLYSTIAWENLPQLAIQIWYTVDRGVDEVALWAFLSSIVSVFIAVIDVYSSRALIRAMKSAEKANRMFKGQPYFLEILGNYDVFEENDKEKTSEIEAKRKLLLMKPNAIRRILGEVLEIDHRAIELTLCVSIAHGIQFGFTLYTADAGKVSRQQRLFTILDSLLSLDGEFVNSVMLVWNLEHRPIITNIETLYNNQDEYEANEYNLDMKSIKESEIYSTNASIFEFNTIDKYHIITIVPHNALDSRMISSSRSFTLETLTSIRNNRQYSDVKSESKSQNESKNQKKSSKGKLPNLPSAAKLKRIFSIGKLNKQSSFGDIDVPELHQVATKSTSQKTSVESIMYNESGGDNDNNNNNSNYRYGNNNKSTSIVEPESKMTIQVNSKPTTAAISITPTTTTTEATAAITATRARILVNSSTPTTRYDEDQDVKNGDDYDALSDGALGRNCTLIGEIMAERNNCTINTTNGNGNANANSDKDVKTGTLSPEPQFHLAITKSVELVAGQEEAHEYKRGESPEPPSIGSTSVGIIGGNSNSKSIDVTTLTNGHGHLQSQLQLQPGPHPDPLRQRSLELHMAVVDNQREYAQKFKNGGLIKTLSTSIFHFSQNSGSVSATKSLTKDVELALSELYDASDVKKTNEKGNDKDKDNDDLYT